MKSRIEFLENAAKLLNISFNEAANMSIGALTMRLSVMQEMREKDNKRQEETGRSGPWSDVNRSNEQFIRDLERATGEKMDSQKNHTQEVLNRWDNGNIENIYKNN